MEKIKRAVEIDFYFKEDCHLCERMESEFNQFLSTMESMESEVCVLVTKHDIEDDPLHMKKYREYVPVLVVDGEEVCHYFFDEEELNMAIYAESVEQ